MSESRVAVVVIGGESSPIAPLLEAVSTNDGPPVLVAVDRGAQYCFEQGHLPQVLIGDFDSCPETTLAHFESKDVPVHRALPEKDQSDFELALRWLDTEGHTRALVTCAFGGRLDHLLANLFLTRAAVASRLAMVFADTQQCIAHVRAGSSLSFELEAGETFSVLPLEDSELSLSGSRWPLARERIVAGSSRTLSNESLGEPVVVLLHEGSALLSIQSSRAELLRGLLRDTLAQKA